MKTALLITISILTTGAIVGWISLQGKTRDVQASQSSKEDSAGQGRNEQSQSKLSSAQTALQKPRARSPLTEEQLNHLRKTVWEPVYAAVKEGESRLASGDFAGAEQSARRALEIEAAAGLPNGQGHFLIADSLMGRKQFGKALEHYRKGSLNSWRLGIQYDLAFCLFKAGHIAEARKMASSESFVRGASLTKADLPGVDNANTLEATLLLCRGMDLRIGNRSAQALQNIEAASRLAPNNAAVLYYKARTLEDLNRRPEAKVIYKSLTKTAKGKIAEDSAVRAR